MSIKKIVLWSLPVVFFVFFAAGCFVPAQFGAPGNTGIKGVIVMPDNTCYTYNCSNPQVSEGEPAAEAEILLQKEDRTVYTTAKADACGKYEIGNVEDACYILYAKIKDGNAWVKKGIDGLTSGKMNDVGEANYYTTAQVIIYEVAKQMFPDAVKCSDIPGFVPTQALLTAVKDVLSQCKDAQQDQTVISLARGIVMGLFGAPGGGGGGGTVTIFEAGGGTTTPDTGGGDGGNGENGGDGGNGGDGESEEPGKSSTYTVTYDANGGTNPPSDSNAYYEGNTVTVLGPGSMSRTGYAFTGWNMAADGSGTGYSPEETFTMPSDNVTLYAQWVCATPQITNVSVSSSCVCPDGYGFKGVRVCTTCKICTDCTVTVTVTATNATHYKYELWIGGQKKDWEDWTTSSTVTLTHNDECQKNKTFIVKVWAKNANGTCSLVTGPVAKSGTFNGGECKPCCDYVLKNPSASWKREGNQSVVDLDGWVDDNVCNKNITVTAKLLKGSSERGSASKTASGRNFTINDLKITPTYSTGSGSWKVTITLTSDGCNTKTQTINVTGNP